MRVRIASRRYRFAPVLLLLVASLADAQTRVEQGRDVLNTVRAMHLMIDFGGEALAPDQLDSLTLAEKLAQVFLRRKGRIREIPSGAFVQQCCKWRNSVAT